MTVSLEGLEQQISSTAAQNFVAMAQPGSPAFVQALMSGQLLGKEVARGIQAAVNNVRIVPQVSGNFAPGSGPGSNSMGPTARGAIYGARGLALGRTNVMAANGRQLVIGEDGAEAIVPLSQRVGGKGPTSGTVAVHFNGPVTFASDQDVDQVAEKLSQRLRAAMNNSTHLNSKGR